MIFGISCRETQNFWSPKQHRKEFRISDPPNNKGENSEFLIPKEYNEGFRISDPQRAQQRIQNFWSPKSTGKDSVFLIPQRFRISDPQQWHTKGFRISDPLQRHTKGCWISDLLQRHRKVFRVSDPPKNTGEDSEFLIHRGTWPGKDPEFLISHWTGFPTFYPQRSNILLRGIRISPKQPKRKNYFLSGLKAVTKFGVKIIVWGFWGKLKNDYKLHDINFIQSPVLLTSIVITLNHIIEDRV